MLFGLVSTYVCALNGSTTALQENSLCVYTLASERVQHFMDSLCTPRRTALISYLFEVCLNLQSSQANNEKSIGVQLKYSMRVVLEHGHNVQIVLQ